MRSDDEIERGSLLSDTAWSEHPVRARLLTTLSSAGGALSFKEIVGATGLSPSLCAYHLGTLSSRGLIDRSFEHSVTRRDYSFYRLSERGGSVLALRTGEGAGAETSALPRRISLIAWKNLPRCFTVKRCEI